MCGGQKFGLEGGDPPSREKASAGKWGLEKVEKTNEGL